MKGQNLNKRFIELVEEVLAFFPGSIHEKMTAWCLSIWTSDSPNFSQQKLQAIAQDRASTLLFKIYEWLNEKENNGNVIIVSNYLKVYIEGPNIRIGNDQLGYIVANALTGLILPVQKHYYEPILPTPISLYKYVSWEPLEKILSKAKLKASEPRKCNDVYEFMPAWETEEQKNEIFEILDGLEMLMICLSRTPASSVMWGQYANNGEGALLHFSVPVYKLIAGRNENECLLVVAKDEKDLYRSINEQRPIIMSQVNYTDERPAFSPKRTYYEYEQLFSCKGTDWAYEQEMRIIFNKDDLETKLEESHYLTPILMPFLKSIILGQRCCKTEEDVRKLIGEGHDWLQTIPIHKTQYSSISNKLKVPAKESLEINSIPLYRRLALGINPQDNDV